MSGRLRVLILGGYGVFGGRLARLLADEARLTLVIAGRSEATARAFAGALGGAAAAEAAAFDRGRDAEAQLRALAPDLVVDASGPFQDYGADPYGLVRAAIALKIDYMDFADGAGFVAGIAAFDAEARARGVFVLSGVSSFPVLTAAVVRRLAGGLAQVRTITGGIAPSPYAGVGPNVIRAIAGYAGKPVRLTRDGAPATGHGLAETRRFTIAPPGAVPLENRLFSLVEVPDLVLLAQEWPGLRAIWMGAGPVPETLHRMLIGLAWLVRLRLLPSLAPLAPLFHLAVNRLRWGEHRGGMFVRVTGETPDGRPAAREWHMIAEGDEGPLIPSMAIEALVRRCLDGKRPVPGARAATRELELDDYERLFAHRAVVAGFRAPAPEGVPLYRRLLGAAWDRLPEPLRRMHEPGGGMVAQGRATVEGAGNAAARLIARTFGFPPAGADVAVRVRFTPTAQGERWERDFAGWRFVSHQAEGRDRSDRLLAERFGPFTFGLALVLDGDRLRLVPRRWSLLGLPLPLALMPGGEAFETVEDGRFRFHVEIGLPLVGRIVRYRGWLEPEAAPAHSA